MNDSLYFLSELKVATKRCVCEYIFHCYTKANKSGEEAQKETMRLIDIGLPQSKNKVNSNSNSKARIESKIQ